MSQKLGHGDIADGEADVFARGAIVYWLQNDTEAQDRAVKKP